MFKKDEKLAAKTVLDDILSAQKKMTAGYNSDALECDNVAIREDLLNILREEHDIESHIYKELLVRKFRITEPADKAEINAEKNKFYNIKNTL